MTRNSQVQDVPQRARTRQHRRNRRKSNQNVEKCSQSCFDTIIYFQYQNDMIHLNFNVNNTYLDSAIYNAWNEFSLPNIVDALEYFLLESIIGRSIVSFVNMTVICLDVAYIQSHFLYD